VNRRVVGNGHRAGVRDRRRHRGDLGGLVRRAQRRRVHHQVRRLGVCRPDCREVKGFDPLQYVDKKDVKKMDTFIHYAIAASQFAVADSGLVIGPGTRRASACSSRRGSAGSGPSSVEHQALLEGGTAEDLAVLSSPRPSSTSPPAGVDRLGAKGRTWRRRRRARRRRTPWARPTRSSHARRRRRDDRGGSEAAITPMGVGGFAAMRALSTRNEEPARASRPFDKDRDGFVIGEGAGVLVLEDLEHARRAAPASMPRWSATARPPTRTHHGAVG